MKSIKLISIGLLISMVSFIITFTLFELLSWYHFGDIPTDAVAYRLMLFFILTNIFIYIGIFLKNIIRPRKKFYTSIR